jgi:CarD family transcriptional regulator
VIYPLYGIGKVVEVKEWKVEKKKETFYVIEFASVSGRVMVPKAQVEKVGLRKPIAKHEISRVIKILKSSAPCKDEDVKWRRRYKDNSQRLKQGSIFEIAKVVKNLSERKKMNTLSNSERNMFDNAVNLIVSELSVAEGTRPERVSERIKKILA